VLRGLLAAGLLPTSGNVAQEHQPTVALLQAYAASHLRDQIAKDKLIGGFKGDLTEALAKNVATRSLSLGRFTVRAVESTALDLPYEIVIPRLAREIVDDRVQTLTVLRDTGLAPTSGFVKDLSIRIDADLVTRLAELYGDNPGAHVIKTFMRTHPSNVEQALEQYRIDVAVISTRRRGVKTLLPSEAAAVALSNQVDRDDAAREYRRRARAIRKAYPDALPSDVKRFASRNLKDPVRAYGRFSDNVSLLTKEFPDVSAKLIVRAARTNGDPRQRLAALSGKIKKKSENGRQLSLEA
jgi:hypothetical protein